MNTITILAISTVLAAGTILSVTGSTVISSVVAQATGDNATMSGNITAGTINLSDARKIISAAEREGN